MERQDVIDEAIFEDDEEDVYIQGLAGGGGAGAKDDVNNR